MSYVFNRELKLALAVLLVLAYLPACGGVSLFNPPKFVSAEVNGEVAINLNWMGIPVTVETHLRCDDLSNPDDCVAEVCMSLYGFKKCESVIP